MTTMENMPESMRWLLTGALMAVLLLGVFATQALAREAPPQQATSPLGVWMESTHFKLNWTALASGGGTMTSSHFVLSATIAQPAIGEMSSAHFKACSGYWCGISDFVWRIMLPLILK